MNATTPILPARVRAINVTLPPTTTRQKQSAITFKIRGHCGTTFQPRWTVYADGKPFMVTGIHLCVTASSHKNAMAMLLQLGHVEPLPVEKPVVKGSVVKYKDGYVKVTAIFPGKGTCNLGSIFNGVIYNKNVKLSEVREAHDEWHKTWQQSESYQCM